MRTLATALSSIVMALTAFGLAVAAPAIRRADEPRYALAGAAGALRIANSREGQAVFSAGAMRPGESVSGSVRIGNDGDLPGRFWVAPSGIQDTPGPYGGVLSERVQLVLLDVTDQLQPTTVYEGPPAGFAERDLGMIAPGAHRDYVAAATLPDGGIPGSTTAGDNVYQGSAFSFGLEWRAVAAGGSTTPTPVSPTAPSGAPAPAPPASAPPAGEVAGAALADALGLPRRGACVQRRRLAVPIKAPSGASIRSATIAVNGKLRARVSGAQARRPVKLRRLPEGPIKLSVTVRATNGRLYNGTRTYKPCKDRKGTRKLSLR